MDFLQQLDFTSVAGIVLATLALTQVLKQLKFLANVPAFVISLVVGTGCALVAVYVLHSIQGDPKQILIQVLLGLISGVLASGGFDAVKGKSRT